MGFLNKGLMVQSMWQIPKTPFYISR